MKTKFLAAVLVSLFSLESWCQNIGDVMTDQRAKELVAKMTLEEKCDYIGGARSFVLRPIERLGIPEIHLADGPQGVRNWTSNSTLYPCGILTAATWNKELAYEYGEALGRDARARGVAFILGPGVNIYRSPLCGRNYEYFGEDPYLTSETAKSYILGVQSEGVIATIKHFAANNQEWSRHHASSDVDERTLHEIYFPAFRKAVQEAHVGAVMDSYNLIYGVHSSENRWMNIDVLRNMWGFDGILMSDWTSVYSSTGAANGGLDLECPKGVYFTKERLIPLIECGLVSEDDIDLKVYHILHTLNRFGLLDRPALDSSVPQDNPENDKVALKVAEEGIVMLENRNSELPFGKRDRVLVLGANAEIVTSGGGSGLVKPYNSISVAEGLRRIHGEKYVEVLTEDVLYEDILPEVHTEDGQQGFSATFYCNKELSGEPVVRRVDNRIGFDWGSGSPVENVPEDGFSVRWDGKYTASSTGMLRFVISGDDGYRLLINGVKVGGDWGNHSISSRTVFYGIEAGKEYHLRYEFYDNLSDAKVSLSAGLFNEKKLVTAAERADRVVYCAGFNSDIEGEGFDRPFRLPKAQTDLIKTLTELNPHVTVVVNAGGGVDFNGWSEDVESILMAWYAGQQGGTAVAEVLVGKVSPSGKLPISIEDKWEDNPAHDNYYDNTPVRTQGAPHKRVEYREGVFIGYRGYDRNNVSPRYPFGYGLSYAKFEYSDLKLKKMSEDSYDLEACRWSNIPDMDFALADDWPWTLGQFVWTGFDYLGEPTPYDVDSWPNHSSVFGIIDLASIPKDRYYLYRSVWNRESPTLHIVPHWTWPGREGLVTPVYVYTSYPEAELFLNGKSMGRRVKAKVDKPTDGAQTSSVEDRYRLMWNDVEYEPGELRVVAYDDEGKAVAEKTVRTAGKPYALRLECDRAGCLVKDGEDLAYVTVSVVDKEGNPVPADSREVSAVVTGNGKFRSIANGDPTCLELFHEPHMHLFSGKLTVIVQSGKASDSGSEGVSPAILTVRAKGLKPASIEL